MAEVIRHYNKKVNNIMIFFAMRQWPVLAWGASQFRIRRYRRHKVNTR